jgi:hypothetical protein
MVSTMSLSDRCGLCENPSQVSAVEKIFPLLPGRPHYDNDNLRSFMRGIIKEYMGPDTEDADFSRTGNL